MKDYKEAGCIGALDLLLIAFIILKLCKIITWSWLWVLSPIWIPFALIMIIIIGVAIKNAK